MKDFDSLKSELEKETGAKIELTPIQCEQNTAPTTIDSEVANRIRTALKKLRSLDARPVGIGGERLDFTSDEKALTQPFGLQWTTWRTNPTNTARSTISSTTPKSSYTLL